MRNLVWLVALALAVVVAAGCVGFFGQGAPQRSHEEINQTIADSNPVISAVSRETDPNLVPIPTAFNQSLAEFWSFTIDGPYSSDPNWTTAALDAEPVILFDINGTPQYYEFYLRNGGTIPGYFWTSANKLMGHGVFRLYQGAPSYNHSQIALDAEKVVKMRYPDYPLVSDVPALYGGGYPMLCRMIMIRNTSNGTDERVVVDAFTLEIVPDHPSEDYKGSEYAWSYLDSVPQGEWPDRIAQWELQESNASGIVAYAMSQGIDVRLSVSPQNASIIRNYSSAGSPGSSLSGPDSTPAVLDAHPITNELIRENEVPVDTARVQAQSTLWDRQVDRPRSLMTCPTGMPRSAAGSLRLSRISVAGNSITYSASNATGLLSVKLLSGPTRDCFPIPGVLRPPLGNTISRMLCRKPAIRLRGIFPALSRSQPGRSIPLPITAAIMLLS